MIQDDYSPATNATVAEFWLINDATQSIAQALSARRHVGILVFVLNRQVISHGYGSRSLSRTDQGGCQCLWVRCQSCYWVWTQSHH